MTGSISKFLFKGIGSFENIRFALFPDWERGMNRAISGGDSAAYSPVWDYAGCMPDYKDQKEKERWQNHLPPSFIRN